MWLLPAACAQTDLYTQKCIAARTPKPILQTFMDKDDIESYLDMFERVAAQQEWPRETWATQLAGLLSGNALDRYSSLPSDRSRDYANLKAAILRRYMK